MISDTLHRNSNVTIRYTTIEMILSFMILFSSNPYITHYLFGPFYAVVSGGLSLLLLCVVVLDYKGKMPWDNCSSVWGIFLAAFILYGIIMFVTSGNIYDIRKSIGIFTKIVFVYSTLLILQRHYNQYLSFLFKSNVVIILLSIVLFFILIFGVDMPYLTFTKADNRMHYFYWIGATNISINFGFARLIRIAGYADEPGAFALILSYLLVLNEFTYKSKGFRILFSIAGLLSFSMAFIISYVPIMLYWICNKIISFKAVVSTLIIVFVIIGIISNIDESIKETLDALLFKRFEISDDGTFEGDNRSFAFPIQLEGFMKNPILGVGSDPEIALTYKLGYPSVISYLTTHGLYGLCFFYLPFLYVVYKYRRSWKLLLLSSLALNYLQRPGIEDMFAMIVLSLIIYSKELFYERREV